MLSGSPATPRRRTSHSSLRPAGQGAGLQEQTPEPRERVGMRRFPFGALELVSHPLALAECRGWCAEREAPYANSLPNAGDSFHESPHPPPGHRRRRNDAGIPGKSWHAVLPFRRVRARPTPSRISRMSWLVRRKGSAVCQLATGFKRFHGSPRRRNSRKRILLSRILMSRAPGRESRTAVRRSGEFPSFRSQIPRRKLPRRSASPPAPPPRTQAESRPPSSRYVRPCAKRK